jgi:hypothetical protein
MAREIETKNYSCCNFAEMPVCVSVQLMLIIFWLWGAILICLSVANNATTPAESLKTVSALYCLFGLATVCVCLKHECFSRWQIC